MKIDIVTALPDSLVSILNTGILRIAQEKKLVEYNIHNLHQYSDNKFGHIDDTPYGGGAGMVIACEPVFKCIEGLKSEREYDDIIYMSADGNKLDQSISNELSLHNNIIILAGRYKGIDQRIRDILITKEISIGDFVLTGGELPALVLIDSIVRLIPGAMSDSESALDDSFQDGLLEPPIYTRPDDYNSYKVPEILLSGNHKKIKEWRAEKSLEKTKLRRPDLLIN